MNDRPHDAPVRQLSAKSSLALLKQEAKRWLKALREHEPDARVRITAAWPAAPAEPTLRDVHHALAREHGLRDWNTLVAAVEEIALDRQSHDERVAALLRHGWDGDTLIARRIAARYADVRRDSIYTAAACGDIDAVRRLLARQPSLATSVDPVRGWTALCHVAYGRIDETHALAIAELLLDAGADVHFRWDDGWGNPFTLITGAIGEGEGVKSTHPQARALVDLFIARGADPFDTQTLYNTSIVRDDTTWMALLWEHSVARDRTAVWSEGNGVGLGGRVVVGTLNYLLGNAVANNHLRRAAWLLEHGASANTLHAYSKQPVHTHARLAGFSAMVALLEQHGARAEALNGEHAFTAALMNGDFEDVRMRAATAPALITSAAPLLAAAGHGRARAVALLIELGADVNARDHTGTTPLHNAAHANSVDTTDVLLAAGATVDVRDGRFHATAMGWACHLGAHHVADRLTPVTRDVRALAQTARIARLAEVLRDEPALANHHLAQVDGPTPLFCLPNDEEQAVDVARVLLSFGADTTVRNRHGRTAVDVARLRGLDDAAALMER